MNKLYQYRKELDELDKHILDLLLKRWNIVSKIFQHKHENELLFTDVDRESEVLNGLSQDFKGKIEYFRIRNVFECIITNSKKIAKAKLHK